MQDVKQKKRLKNSFLKKRRENIVNYVLACLSEFIILYVLIMYERKMLHHGRDKMYFFDEMHYLGFLGLDYVCNIRFQIYA